MIIGLGRAVGVVVDQALLLLYLAAKIDRICGEPDFVLKQP